VALTEWNNRKLIQANKCSNMRNDRMSPCNAKGNHFDTTQERLDKVVSPIYIVGKVFLLGLIVLANEIWDVATSRAVELLVASCLGENDFAESDFDEKNAVSSNTK